jgi:glycosyltransferase involved in cell wall biosynthesis
MRILYHHRTQSEDAQGIHVQEMVNAFRDLGHQVQMVALVEMDRKGERKVRGRGWKWLAPMMPVWLYELMSVGYNLYGYGRLSRAIRTHRPDFLYERYALNTFCGVWASRRHRIPHILEVNAPLAYEQERLQRLVFKRFARFLERWICSHSSWTVVVSSVMRKMLIEAGVPDEKLVVMPNGINPVHFRKELSGEAIRERYRLGHGPVIGFVGWFRKWHGLEMLLEIAREARWRDAGVRLLLVGDGPARASLEDFCREYGLESTVVFTGPVERKDIPAHVAAMDITVQPSAPEYSCPMKIFEYMAMGRCIVAPDQANIRECLDDGSTAFLFSPGDAVSLKDVLLRLLNEPELRREMGERAHRAVFERGFLWETNARRAAALANGHRGEVAR